jgi:hypothetical protein
MVVLDCSQFLFSAYSRLVRCAKAARAQQWRAIYGVADQHMRHGAYSNKGYCPSEQHRNHYLRRNCAVARTQTRATQAGGRVGTKPKP